MRVPLAAAIVLVLLSSGCESFKGSFQESFDKSFKESCRKQSIQAGASQQIADKYCDCALQKFKETKSMDQSINFCVDKVKSEMHR
jgi:hypothetical protein